MRHHSLSAIGRVVGVSKQNAQKAFHRALHRNTDQDIQTHHRGELAKLDMEEANVWRAMDANKENGKRRCPGPRNTDGIMRPMDFDECAIPSCEGFEAMTSKKAR